MLNVNDWDPRFRYPQYEFFIPDVAPNQLTPGTVIGKVEAADGDRGDHVTLSLRGPYSRLVQERLIYLISNNEIDSNVFE